MTRFFFHTDNGVAHHDADGLELLNAHAAGIEAVRFFGELLVEAPDAFWSAARLTVTVTDKDGRVAFALQASLLRVALT